MSGRDIVTRPGTDFGSIQGKGTTMTRQRILLATLAAGVVLSLTATLQASTRVVFSASNHGVGISVGTRIGVPTIPPGRYPPRPAHRHVVVVPPRRPRFVRFGPPVVVQPPVVRRVVIQPAPPVVIQVPPPVQETTIIVWITNSNGSKTSVNLTREGAWYVGPRGEYYMEMPTNEQLRVVYGF